MAITVENAIERYKESYFNYYGRYPEFETNVGWIRLDNSPVSYRPSQVFRMARVLDRRMRDEGRINEQMADDNIREILLERLRMRNERDIWDVRDNLDSHVENTITEKVHEMIDKMDVDKCPWKNHINTNIIADFLNTLYHNFNSVVDMEKVMINFCKTGQLYLENHRLELMKYEKRLAESNRKIANQNEMADEYRQAIDNLQRLVRKKDEKIKEIMNNSVVFSMDDIQL